MSYSFGTNKIDIFPLLKLLLTLLPLLPPFPRPQKAKEGRFLLQLKGGISLFKEECPRVVYISSAAVERNQKIVSEEERALEIPIVQLNPRKLLNAKYLGECFVRDSSSPYAIVRPTGLKDKAAEEEEKRQRDGDEGEGDDEDAPAAKEQTSQYLELSQGDTTVGTVTREDVAALVYMIANQNKIKNVTFEVTSRESPLKTLDSGVVLERQLSSLVTDDDRPSIGIPPFPKPDPLPSS